MNPYDIPIWSKIWSELVVLLVIAPSLLLFPLCAVVDSLVVHDKKWRQGYYNAAWAGLAFGIVLQTLRLWVQELMRVAL